MPCVRCKFGNSCTNSNCCYSLPAQSPGHLRVSGINPRLCWYGEDCITKNCTFTHLTPPRGEWSSDDDDSDECKYNVQCNRPDCRFLHPDGRIMDGTYRTTQRRAWNEQQPPSYHYFQSTPRLPSYCISPDINPIDYAYGYNVRGPTYDYSNNLHVPPQILSPSITHRSTVLEEQMNALTLKITTSTVAKKEADDPFLCIVCMDRRRSVLLRPCNHLIVCDECAKQLQTRQDACPCCRKSVSTYENVFM